MKWSDVQNLDFQNIGSWPAPIKVVAIAFLCIVILLAGWYVDTKDQVARLGKIEEEETALKTELVGKKKQAANLELLQSQLNDIKESFGDMLKRLPNKTEIAALLVDISQQGLGAGLEFELFKPLEEVPKDFYAEKPINLRVTGDYHEFGEFVSGIAELPRIVTQHNIKITTRGRNETLVLESTAKTYRYLEEEETSQ